MGKTKALAATDERSEVGASVREFYAAVVNHYATGESVETGLGVLERGLKFLKAASERWRLLGGSDSNGTEDNAKPRAFRTLSVR